MATTKDPATVNKADNKPFRFFDLPDELWSKIGKMHIDTIDEINDPDELSELDKLCFDKLEIEKIRRRWDRPPPAATQVCRQFRNELLPYYFRTHIAAALHVCRRSFGEVTAWLVAMGANERKHIGEAWFNFGFLDFAEKCLLRWRNAFGIEAVIENYEAAVEEDGEAEIKIKFVWTKTCGNAIDEPGRPRSQTSAEIVFGTGEQCLIVNESSRSVETKESGHVVRCLFLPPYAAPW